MHFHYAWIGIILLLYGKGVAVSCGIIAAGRSCATKFTGTGRRRFLWALWGPMTMPVLAALAFYKRWKAKRLAADTVV